MNKKEYAKQIESKSSSHEPVISEPLTEETKNSVLTSVLNWYSNFRERSDVETSLPVYMKGAGFTEEQITEAQKLDIKKLPATNLYLTRIIEKNGNVLPPSSINRLNLGINKFLDSSEEKAESQVVVKVRPSIQYSMRMKASVVLAEVDKLYDEVMFGGSRKVFNLAEILKTHNSSLPVAKIIKGELLKGLTEIKLAEAKTDEYVNEVYRGFDFKTIVFMVKVYENLIGDLDQFLGGIKVERAPRKTKPKSPEKITRYTKFLKEDSSLNLTSLSPTKILGSPGVWLYNVKTKTLTNLNSDGKLNIKGTSIVDFNSSKSSSKTLRKPKEVLDKVMNGGKVALKHLMDSLTTKPKGLSGRLNKDVLILKTV